MRTLDVEKEISVLQHAVKCLENGNSAEAQYFVQSVLEALQVFHGFEKEERNG